MKHLTLILILLLSSQLFAQNFYDLYTIQTIEITFAQSNWDQLLDDEKAGDDNYIMAESVTLNGETFDSVGVKYKGNSTYNSRQTKNPFHIELDTYKDQDYEGYTDIKLSNAANDPSFLREVLSYHIIRQYMDSPLSNYANVYVNGTLIGLYSNSEAISKKFLKSRFGSKNNTFIKCNPPDGAGIGTTDLPNLIYLGQDSSDYYNAYELKSDAGWQELINLTDTLANFASSIENIIDVDRALWMLALDNVLVNLDSYIGQFSQNYYLYKDNSGQFIPIIWDLNESFGRFSQTGTTNLNSTYSKQIMSHLLHNNDNTFPLVQKLLSTPTYKRMYLAHYKTILLENFENNSYYNTGLELQNTIDAAVQADNNKFFTYANFIDNLTDDIISGGGPQSSTTPGISNLMDGRNTYLLTQSDFTQTEPVISNISSSNETPVINDSVYITALISDASSAILGYKNETENVFAKIQMFDDGFHNDVAANDGIFGVALKITNVFTQYFIYAENDNIGKFSPERAQHEYYTITATSTETEISDLVINEFMASNESTVTDQDGEYDDWIELYNNSSSTINLEGYYLSDDADDLIQWPFPSGTTIQGNGYLIVWADKDEDQEGLHASFKISATSETLFLTDATGTIINEISSADQNTDESFGRIPNGTGNFKTTVPSFNSENLNLTANYQAYSINDISIYPNPASESFNILFNDSFENNQAVKIYDILGNLIFWNSLSQSNNIDCSAWAKGIYIVKIKNTAKKISVR